MQRSIISKILPTQILNPGTHFTGLLGSKPPCDVFINHRGTDTKRTIAGLLFQHLTSLGLNPFLDSKTMRPGDRLFDTIDPAIKSCRVGLAVFSQRYCESYFCLHELALMMECKKKVLPVFVDVKPSELRIENNTGYSTNELTRFNNALEEAKYTVGLNFDSLNGDWSEFLKSATNIIIQRLLEEEENQHYLTQYFIQHGNNPNNLTTLTAN